MEKKLTLMEDGSKSLIYCLKVFVITGIGQLVGAIINYILIDVFMRASNPELARSAFMVTAREYLVFTGIWLVFFIYYATRKTERGILGIVGTKLRGNNILMFAAGILIGFTMNFTCGYLAMRNGDFSISYVGFNPLQTLIVFVAIMIQSGAEELLCRGLLYKSLERRFGPGLRPIIISSLLFAALHLFNSGVTVLSLVNLVLAGIVPALMMYYFDSMWMCIAEHTAWNFTQNILLGLPNSGIRVPFSIFALSSDTVRDSFFYNVGFGIEGGMMATIVHIAVIVLMVIFMNRRRKPEYDVWRGITEEEVERIEQEKLDVKTRKQIKKYTEKDYKKKLKKDPEYTYKQLLDYEISREEKAKKSQFVAVAIVLALTLLFFVFAPTGIDKKQIVAMLFGEVIAFITLIPASRKLVNRRIELLTEYLGNKYEESVAVVTE